jgi:hypothetical protein
MGTSLSMLLTMQTFTEFYWRFSAGNFLTAPLERKINGIQQKKNPKYLFSDTSARVINRKRITLSTDLYYQHFPGFREKKEIYVMI